MMMTNLKDISLVVLLFCCPCILYFNQLFSTDLWVTIPLIDSIEWAGKQYPPKVIFPKYAWDLGVRICAVIALTVANLSTDRSLLKYTFLVLWALAIEECIEYTLFYTTLSKIPHFIICCALIINGILWEIGLSLTKRVTTMGMGVFIALLMYWINNSLA